jgi:CRISPR-associated endonuclease/helicase Cas3
VIVVVVSECKGKARDRTQSIVDEFLPRIGRRTWSGAISEEGLTRLRKELRSEATKATCIVCHRVTGRSRLIMQWRVGRKGAFDLLGRFSISQTSRSILRQESPAGTEGHHRERVFGSVVGLAALFHDLGKATTAFQKKLEVAGGVVDTVRHELISALLILKVQEQSVAVRQGSAAEINAAFLDVLSEPAKAASAWEKAWTAVLADLVAEAAKESLPRLHTRIEGRLAMLLAMLCIGHHKLPESETSETAQKPFLKPDAYIRLGDATDRKARGASDGTRKVPASLKTDLKLSKDGLPPWRSPSWLGEVAGLARRLKGVGPDELSALEAAFALLGRFVLQAADHTATAEAAAKVEPRKRHGLHSHSGPRAPDGSPTFVDTLDRHLRSVATRAQYASRILPRIRSAMPALSGDDLPPLIAHPSAPEGSRFRWQVDAAAAAGRIVRTDPDEDRERMGFFGVLAAGTGAGKTIAAPVVLAAASEGSLRYVMGLGLRTLTLQTADEYVQRIGMPMEAVSTIIGSPVAAKLHAMDGDPAGSDRRIQLSLKDDLEAITVEVEGSVVGHDAAEDLPAAIERFAIPGERSADARKAAAMLAAPVLVCTVDTVMSAADRRFGRHLTATARVLTSDLVLDEIDDYGAEDMVALCRLVHVTGAGGGRVIVSSATITAMLATELFRSYREGLAIHAAMTGRASNFVVPCCYATDAVDAQRAFLAADVDAYAENLSGVTTTAAAAIRARLPVRRADILPVSEAGTEVDFHRRIFEGVKKAHDAHGQRDPGTGIHASVGVVRFSNVASATAFSRYLLEKPSEEDLEVVVVPYVGTLLPPVRHLVEKTLDGMLKRTCSTQADDPIFLPRSPIRTRLDACNQRHLVAVVATTSLEEVGRDHDFDWAISEISSARGLVQLAGRVRRHRRFPGSAAANVLLLDVPKKLLQKQWGDVARDDRVLSLPGIETPYRGRKGSRAQVAPSAAPYDAASLIDFDRWQIAIDAAEFVDPGAPRSRLAKIERERLTAFLSDGLDVPWLTARHATGNARALWTSNHARQRIFRRSEGDAMLVANPYQTGGKGYGWAALIHDVSGSGGARTEDKSGVIGSLHLDAAAMERLLVPLGYEETTALYEDLLSRIEPGARAEDIASREMLMSMSVPVGRNGSVHGMTFHPALGLTRR